MTDDNIIHLPIRRPRKANRVLRELEDVRAEMLRLNDLGAVLKFIALRHEQDEAGVGGAAKRLRGRAASLNGGRRKSKSTSNDGSPDWRKPYIFGTMSIIISSSTEFMADPQRLYREIQAGNTVFLSDVGYTIGPSAESIVEDINEAEDMAALRTDVTGVDNTVFVSPKGYARHAARIKIAVDPPHSLDPTAKKASMAIHDYSITGAYLPPQIVEQAKHFIDRNRETLLRYWNHEIDTDEMIKRLK